MSKVTKLYPKDSAKNPDAVLEQAIGVYDSVLLIGWDKNGWLDVKSSTNLKVSDLNFLVSKFQFKLLRGDYSGGE